MARDESDLEDTRLEKSDRETKEKDIHRSREKDKDGYREAEKERDRIRERDRVKEREHRDKDKGKDADRDKERHRDREKDKEKETDKDKQRVKDRDREREKDRERERRKEREKERERDRERDREREKELERDKDAENRRHRPKEGERDAERDRDADKEKKKDRERDRDRKERERGKDKERDAERERDRDNREREREKRRGEEKDKEKERDKDREKERDIDMDRARQKGSERDKDKDQEELKDRGKEVHLKGKDKGKDEERSQKEPDKPQISPLELQERIDKMKKERTRNLDMKKSTNKGDGESEIAAWVNKSRSLQKKTNVIGREKAARLEKTLTEQEFEDEKSDEEYETKDLAGLKVLHGLDKVMEGGAIVLTLKDRNILAGDDLDEEMDELENIEIAEQKARENAYKAAKKGPGVYEDKFHGEFSASRTILPQYDDIVKDEGLILDETGGINEESKKRLEEIRQRLQNATMKGLVYDSFSSEAARVAADFYTQEEMLQFKKPKKKKKLRKKVDIDIDALEAEAKAAGLGTGDLGSRSSVARIMEKKEEEKAVLDSRRNAYQTAYEKAVEASKVLLPESSGPVDMEMDEQVFGADEDEELSRSLERARFAALKKQGENGGSVAGPQAVAARLAALKEEADSASLYQVVTESDSEKPVVITDTGEFCLSLQLDEVISRRAGAKDVFGEEDDVGLAAAKESEVSKNEGGWIEVKEANPKDLLSEEKEEETVLEEPIKEISVGKGLSGALSLLKERGTLKETVDWGGRNMDKKRSKLVGIVDDNPPEPTRHRDILLDRLDEFGRTMTPKEAFRRLSHKFHGKGPGKMKQEKKMKQYQEELKLKQMNSGDTPLMSMEKMRETQAKMHTPYIVISGHIKPGQTSDPRSGFATVEKEAIGSLTPMLGDKKVEHFLGIKRKPEPGSMGPPPPKKPKSER